MSHRSDVTSQERLPSRGMSPSYFRSIWAIIWKDLAAELRSRELLSAMLVFALLVIFIFNFALELDAAARYSVTSGVLWVTFAFAGTLGLNRSMAMEKDRGCLDGLLLAPVDRSAIYFGKMIGNLIFMLIVEVIVLPVYSILYISSRADRRSAAWLAGVRGCRHAAGEYGGADPHARYLAADPAVSGRYPAVHCRGPGQRWLFTGFADE